MPELPYNAAELIRQSYVLAQVWDPGEEQPGVEAQEGLMVLNTIISEWSESGTLIPAYKTIQFDLEQEDYKFEYNNVITEVLEANLRQDAAILVPLYSCNLQEFNRLNFDPQAITGRPDRFYVEPNEDNIQTKTNVWFWPPSNGDYTSLMRIKQIIAQMDYNDEITTLPLYMFKALKYQVASDLRDTYGTTLADNFAQEYTRIMNRLKGKNKRDMSVQVNNQFAETRRMRPWNIYSN